MNEIGPLLVKLSHLIVQSHITFLMRMEEFILQMCIVVYANVFLLDKTFILLKCAHMCFMHIFFIYAHLAVSLQRFFMRYSKMWIKICGWKHSYCGGVEEDASNKLCSSGEFHAQEH